LGSWGFALGCKPTDQNARVEWVYDKNYAAAKSYIVARAASLGIDRVSVCS
jgi:hypothetical protein